MTCEKMWYVLTTADIWAAQNKSFLSATAHRINPDNMHYGEAALACTRYKSWHTHDSILSGLDVIHSSCGLSYKIPATIFFF